MQIILASSSPSRRAILEAAGVTPVIRPAHVDEEGIQRDLEARAASPADVVLALARAKAESVSSPEDVVIGCDSMLLLDGQLQGKPHTVETTIERWHRQRGKAAELITGHHIITPRGVFNEAVRTTVHFGMVSDADIEAYAHSEEPLFCAGAFTLEALGGWFIDAIEGDPSSVIGLSLPLLRRALYSFGYDASQFWRTS